ncbi:hypothetical protein LJC08_05265 [Methanimicrococcus sp. OttesenSCG-928-J09]|nr:hypothetical protein [Methanimicrococcus sp. OttesenSCG-928-J09]
MHLPNAKRIGSWRAMFVTGWCQFSVLQWEGGLHLKSLRDFCGCRRIGQHLTPSCCLSRCPSRASRFIFLQIKKISVVFSIF